VGRVWARVALAGVGTAVVFLGLTFLVDEVDPVRRTLSEYALLDGVKPLFDLGVLAFAAAAAATAFALVRAGAVRPWSVPTVGLALGALGLVTVVVFEKTNWAVGPSLGGTIHRYASLLAFVALPVAAIAVRQARAARWAGIVSLLWFAPIVVGFAQRPFTGVSWWRAIPLGLVERGLALSEVVAVGLLALWVHSRARREDPRGVLAPAPG
jgi:uncharacterized membrane protein YhaH (DUF805 family)